ncbi:unnamed protein product [Arctogadus glacialis]
MGDFLPERPSVQSDEAGMSSHCPHASLELPPPPPPTVSQTVSSTRWKDQGQFLELSGAGEHPVEVWSTWSQRECSSDPQRALHRPQESPPQTPREPSTDPQRALHRPQESAPQTPRERSTDPKRETLRPEDRSSDPESARLR